MGVVAVLKSKKLCATKLFTVLNDSNIDKVVDHIEELSKGQVIRTLWHHEVGNRLSLTFYMGSDWNYEIEHIVSQIPQIPMKITKCNPESRGLYVKFDKGSPALLYTRGDSGGSKALGMYLEQTYFRLRKIEGKTALMIAELNIGDEGDRYDLKKELWRQA